MALVTGSIGVSKPGQGDNWPMVKGMKFCLAPHIQVYPQCYRGESWFVLRDLTKGRHLRFNALAYEVIGRLDGQRTLEEIWQQLPLTSGEQVTAEAPPDGQALEKHLLNREDMLHLVAQLHAIDALKGELSVPVETMLKRDKQARHHRWQQKLLNPLALRFSLFDPDRFLNAAIRWIKPLLSKAAFLIWLLAVLLAAMLALANSTRLSQAISHDLMTVQNLLLLWLLYPLIKACHEFAHAFVVKFWGGEVHDMGITLLIFMPVPYVDASSAWTFREKRKRILVGAAGIMAELFLAALGLFAYLAVEPGIVSQAALFTFMTGTISTVLFNANPLLRFDGYFILQDQLEIPNLASRASRYYLYLLQRYLFASPLAQSPVTASGERGWFLCYGAGAFFYRLFMLTVIVLFLLKDYLIAGVVLAVWAISLQILLPLWRGFSFLLASEKLAGHRIRAVTAMTGILVLFTCALFFIPVPHTSFAQGVVWVPEQAQIYAPGDGFVETVYLASGTPVEADAPLMEMKSAVLDKNIAVLKAKLKLLKIERQKALKDQPVQLEIIREEASAIEAELAQLQQQKSAFSIKSGQSGVFVLPGDKQLAGQYLQQGELIGYVISPEHLIIRAVVSQSDIGLVRKRNNTVQIRLAEDLNQVIDTQILKMTPAGSKQLPSLALSVEGGGKVVVQRGEDGVMSSKQAMFQIDLALPEGLAVSGLGGRVFVRFDHGSEPLAQQWLRRGRQLVLSLL
ncbi:HlyD family efflux transporter periplasmic adaptor subunit [Thalassomonas actiniarum]|uniref:HlyD family efflux transporter periplasmic adaptor subunit n=1 Tax=Thalassomonas actiniarum TaxID=485447 RepID=A0AAE9YVL5_9GAMM|nr:HlyD family efflux transporter periplasmic adaptor subunit [Thalassomonas actiniarum]WDE01402.1 HlyD family efflux transporter periplasmic adaptor subunit [Thalassomonas actiniarum]